MEAGRHNALPPHRRLCRLWPLWVVLALALVVSVVVLTQYRNQAIWGDESAYIWLAHRDDAPSPAVLRLLPGFMSFNWWPPLAPEIYGLFSVDALRDHVAGRVTLAPEDLDRAMNAFVRRVAPFNAALLLLTCLLIYSIGRQIGLHRLLAATASALVVLNPRVLFYLQALWPELLHFVLLLGAVSCFLRFVAARRLAWLAGASVLLAYASFTKGVASPYWVIMVALLVGLHRKQLLSGRHALVLVLFAVPYLGLTSIQKAVNLDREGAFAISTNTWVNIEVGLLATPGTRPSQFFRRYHTASDDLIERERRSRRRVLHYLETTSPYRVVANLVGNAVHRFPGVVTDSFLAKGMSKGRWTSERGVYCATLLGSLLSWMLLILGTLGLLTLWRRSWAHAILAGYLAYYLTATVFLGFNPRFFVQAIPFLALFAVGLLDRIGRAVVGVGVPGRSGAVAAGLVVRACRPDLGGRSAEDRHRART